MVFRAVMRCRFCGVFVRMLCVRQRVVFCGVLFCVYTVVCAAVGFASMRSVLWCVDTVVCAAVGFPSE